MIQVLSWTDVEIQQSNCTDKIVDFKRKFDLKNPLQQEIYLRVPKDDINMCLFLILRDQRMMERNQVRDELVKCVTVKSKRQQINKSFNNASFIYRDEMSAIKEHSIIDRFQTIGRKILQKYETFKVADKFWNQMAPKLLTQAYMSTYFKLGKQWTLNDKSLYKSFIITQFEQNEESVVLGVFRMRNQLTISQINNIIGGLKNQEKHQLTEDQSHIVNIQSEQQKSYKMGRQISEQQTQFNRERQQKPQKMRRQLPEQQNHLNKRQQKIQKYVDVKETKFIASQRKQRKNIQSSQNFGKVFLMIFSLLTLVILIDYNMDYPVGPQIVKPNFEDLSLFNKILVTYHHAVDDCFVNPIIQLVNFLIRNVQAEQIH